MIGITAQVLCDGEVLQIAPAITDAANIPVPIDKSIPPVAITNVTPRPSIAYGAKDLIMVTRLSCRA